MFACRLAERDRAAGASSAGVGQDLRCYVDAPTLNELKEAALDISRTDARQVHTGNICHGAAPMMPTEHLIALVIAKRDKLNRASEALQGPIKRRGRPPKNPAAAPVACLICAGY
jgi:hypothetical protein